MKHIPISELRPHPENPRLTPREDVIDQIAAQIAASGFDEAHALIVRPIYSANVAGPEFYQIISGHHRKGAAERAGLETVPCWVREMDDATAYMELVRANAQSELTALERGMHALHSGMDVRGYSESVGRAKSSVQHEIAAARVAEACPHVGTNLSDNFRALTEIHAAPRWLWSALVGKMVADEMTVDATRTMVAEVKGAVEPPGWADLAAIAQSIVTGAMSMKELGKFGEVIARAEARVRKNDLEVERFIGALNVALNDARPASVSDALSICQGVIAQQEEIIRAARQIEIDEAKRLEAIAERTARLKRNVSLSEWKELADDERAALLSLESAKNVVFNKQENAAIEWAQWSWNPVTGCLHECPYCYARDIANSSRMAAAYPNGFDPTFRPSMLLAPRTMKVPKEAETDTRFRNVFTCSMADLFGRWVPSEWIEAVLREVRAAPQWNFLFLTKFPKRMAEFDIPDNAWMGTTVDLQARVANAEAAFANVNAGVRWLSIEPMLEPLKFNHLDRFDWIVIGGASASSETPEWRPPFEWVFDLVQQARDAGVKVYFKTNLLGPRMIELPFDAPVEKPPTLPAEFNYLGNKPAA